MQAKILLPPEHSVLATDKQDFTVHIIIFDNLTDEQGEIAYSNYPVLKLRFENGVIVECTEAQKGRYIYPDFVEDKWDKERLFYWLKDYDERDFFPDARSYSFSYTKYRAVLEIEE